jgi:hypothetical protein
MDAQEWLGHHVFAVIAVALLFVVGTQDLSQRRMAYQ